MTKAETSSSFPKLERPSTEIGFLTRALEKLTPGDAVHLSSGASRPVFERLGYSSTSISMDQDGSLYFAAVDDSVRIKVGDETFSPAPGDTIEPGTKIILKRGGEDPQELTVPIPFISKNFEQSDMPEKAERVLVKTAEPELLVPPLAAQQVGRGAQMLAAVLFGPASSLEKPVRIELKSFPDGEEVVVGREGRHGFYVGGSAVSRKHLAVTLLSSGLLSVKDTSTFGTEILEGGAWVRIPKYEPRVIPPGTICRLGGAEGAYALLGAAEVELPSRSSAA